MFSQICFYCFRTKGDYDVCPWCGYAESDTENQAYQLVPGTVLKDRYMIGTTLGIGGFGITYKAYDTVLSVVVAIKEFYPARLVNRGVGETEVGIFSGEKQEDYRRLLEQFQEEARYMAKFSKEPDIVNIYDYVEENKTAYIIMEYVEGTLLKEKLEQTGKLPQEEAEQYIIGILNALAKVHSQGIVHKDVSPDNIFLMGEGKIKLMDFGAARLCGTRSSEEDDAVVKVGYAPPEQYQAGSRQEAAMDIYGAGAVFYEMLTGEKPMDSMDRQMEDTMLSPGKLESGIDERLDRIVMKAVALQTDLRFQTAELFREAIVSRKKVDLPEEELRKRRRMKKFTLAAASAALMISLIVLVLSQTIFSSRGKIDISGIREETLEVWLAVEEAESGQKLAEALKEDVEKKCAQITLDIEIIPSEEYPKRLEQALEQEGLPEVFCTDYWPKDRELSDYAAGLQPLFHTLKLESCLFLPEWEEKKVCELPTTVQAGIVYVNTGKEGETPQNYTKESLKESETILKYADEEDAYKEFKKKKSPVRLIAGDLSDMEKVKNVTTEVVPPTDFQSVPVLEEGKLAGCFVKYYSVKKSRSKNREEASMVVLSSLLSENFQSLACMEGDEGIPLNKMVYEDYREYKMTTYVAFLKEYGEEDMAMQEEKDICEYLRGE